MATLTAVKETWVLGSFADPHALVAATAAMRERGFTHMDTYSPYPLHGGSEALGLPRSKVPLIALIGGLTGLIGAFSFQTYLNTFDYALNVGGRPTFSWPAWVPIMFEFGVLLASFSIFFGLLALSRLPQPYHPVFESEEFRSASTHGYWLSVEAREGQTPERISQEMSALGATLTQVVSGERE
jgi:multisubunit Na+/H+ antiporter MnhG subunit